MRTTLLAMALGGVLLVAAGCGAKVTVDGSSSSSSGAGGTGGTDAGGSTSTGSTSTGSFTCEFACGGPVGLCGCSGPCSDGKMRAIGCGGSTATGVVCDCDVDGVMVGMCDSPGLACQLAGSCCETIFGE